MDIKNIRIDDSIEDAIRQNYAVEVTFELSDGEKRWCFFVTPDMLKSFGDRIDGTQMRLHYGSPYMIVVPEIFEQIIVQAINHINRNNELISSSLPLEEQI